MISPDDFSMYNTSSNGGTDYKPISGFAVCGCTILTDHLLYDALENEFAE